MLRTKRMLLWCSTFSKGRLRAKEKEVREAMKGFFNDFHRDMLAAFYEHYQFLTSQIEKLEARIAERMKLHQEQIELLSGIPGVDKVVAWHLIAELGTDMSVFPSAGHCASWAGVVPGENESAGKKKSTRCRKGNKVLRRILSQAAWGASRKKRSYLRTVVSSLLCKLCSLVLGLRLGAGFKPPLPFRPLNRRSGRIPALPYPPFRCLSV